MRDGFLSDIVQRRAAAPPVAAIAHQGATYRRADDVALDEGDVPARHRVFAKLHPQPALGVHGARENDEAARFLVEPVNDPGELPATSVTLLATVGLIVSAGAPCQDDGSVIVFGGFTAELSPVPLTPPTATVATEPFLKMFGAPLVLRLSATTMSLLPKPGPVD